MLVRTLTGLALVPLLAALLFAPLWAIAAALALMSAIAVYEILGHWPQPIKPRIRIAAGGLSAALYALIYFEAPPYLYLAGFFLWVLYLFAEVLVDFRSFGFFHLAGVFFSALVIPVLYSSIYRIAAQEARVYIVLIPFVVTIVSDVFALFTGLLLGRHKLAPSISPNKSVEGFIGGYVFCVIVMLAYGWVLTALGCSVRLEYLLVYALAGGLASPLGDLALSAVKRGLEIKDFGNLFPGHGGILDRFDSLLLTAPAIELLMIVLPAVTLL